jgi:hypothetical protein
MSEAMARCARENIINRIVCEQKVGREYCDGYWGKVPQCSSARPSEFGR